jgi:hypothetical protein
MWVHAKSNGDEHKVTAKNYTAPRNRNGQLVMVWIGMYTRLLNASKMKDPGIQT